MKKHRVRGHFGNDLVLELERAGYNLLRRAKGHFVYGAPERPVVYLPQTIDSVKVAKKIAKVAGVEL